MKKVLFSAVAAAAMMFAGSAVKAQGSGNVVMTVVTADVVAMTVNVPAVLFTLASSSAYSADQTFSQAAQLTVLSTKPFDLDVKSSSPALTSGSNTLPLNVVKIECTNTDLGVTPSPAITLTTSNQKLLDEASSGLAALINMKYTLLTRSEFASFSGVPTGTYVTTLVYTASVD